MRRLCDSGSALSNEQLAALRDFWLVPKAARSTDGPLVADMDESFHVTLVEAAGNPELTRIGM